MVLNFKIAMVWNMTVTVPAVQWSIIVILIPLVSVEQTNV